MKKQLILLAVVKDKKRAENICSVCKVYGEAEVRHQPERKVYEVWSEVHVKIAKLASEGESDGGK